MPLRLLQIHFKFVGPVEVRVVISANVKHFQIRDIRTLEETQHGLKLSLSRCIPDCWV
jgi:hypothetical protein